MKLDEDFDFVFNLGRQDDYISGGADADSNLQTVRTDFCIFFCETMGTYCWCGSFRRNLAE